VSVVAVKVGVMVGVTEGIGVIDGLNVALGLNTGIGVCVGAGAAAVAVSGGRVTALTWAGVAWLQADRRKTVATDKHR
jgi:hypothetical protein